MRALFFFLPRRLASGSRCNLFVRDSHRKSGVFSSVALLSPVESYVPSGAVVAHKLGIRPWNQGSKRKATEFERGIIPGRIS